MPTFNVKITVEAPPKEPDKGYQRVSIMSMSLESPLSAEMVQKHVNDLFSALTAAAVDAAKPQVQERSARLRVE